MFEFQDLDETSNANKWLLRCVALAEVLFSSVLAVGQSCKEGPIQTAADAKGAVQPLVHFWSKVVGSGRANEGLRAIWQ
jgi:hypothetical protein